LKVCLVRPSLLTVPNSVTCEVSLPTGVAYLAAALRQNGFSVSIVDAIGEAMSALSPVPAAPEALALGLSDQDIVARIPTDVDVIGVSCMFSVNWVINRQSIRAIRAAFPKVPLIVGGEHATALPEYTLRDAPEIDFLVLGEGESTTIALLRALEGGTDPTAVSGIAYLDDGGVYRTTAPRPRQQDIDQWPWPAYDLVPIDDYLAECGGHCIDSGRAISLLTSRGCPHECTFCSNPVMWGRLWRPRDPADIVAEIEHYVRVYQIDHVDLLDMTTVVNRTWIIQLCERMIECKVAVSWQIVNSRTEALDAEVCRLLKRAGCTYVTYPAESGSARRLAVTKKKVDREAMLTSISAAVEAGLGVKLSYMTGFPDDDLKEFLASYWMAVRAAWCGAHDASFFPFMPYPGSEMFRDMVETGEVRLGDAYFFQLLVLQYGFMRSWSHRFGHYQLRALSLLGLAIFYSTAFARRPIRAWRLIVDLARAQGRSKLAAGLIRMRRQRNDIKQTATAG